MRLSYPLEHVELLLCHRGMFLKLCIVAHRYISPMGCILSSLSVESGTETSSLVPQRLWSTSLFQLPWARRGRLPLWSEKNGGQRAREYPRNDEKSTTTTTNREDQTGATTVVDTLWKISRCRFRNVIPYVVPAGQWPDHGTCPRQSLAFCVLKYTMGRHHLACLFGPKRIAGNRLDEQEKPDEPRPSLKTKRLQQWVYVVFGSFRDMVIEMACPVWCLVARPRHRPAARPSVAFFKVHRRVLSCRQG